MQVNDILKKLKLYEFKEDYRSVLEVLKVLKKNLLKTKSNIFYFSLVD